LTTGIFGNDEGRRGEFLTFKTGIPGDPARWKGRVDFLLSVIELVLQRAAMLAMQALY